MSSWLEPSGLVAGNAQFTTTHWTMVLAARQSGTDESAVALEELCRAYWRPLYAYIRRRGYQPEEAQDLTQAFFARLLAKEYLRSVDRNKGKFRSFLLAALEHFLANEWRDARAQKRGGGSVVVSLDDTSVEEHYGHLAGQSLTPEQLFDRQWATTLLERVLGRLREEFAGSGRLKLFEVLKVFLTGDKPDESYAELAAKQGTTPAALKMAVSRMRHRYSELLRAEIASTVSRPEEVDDELNALFAALSL